VRCDLGFSRCGDSCVSILTDDLNCGACGNECRDKKHCVLGRCRPEKATD
jgi:hypothetical protein